MGRTITLKDLISVENPEELLGQVDFEQGLKLLEELVSKVESGALSLDKAVLSYERGMALINTLRSHLEGAEKKIEILNKS